MYNNYTFGVKYYFDGFISSGLFRYSKLVMPLVLRPKSTDDFLDMGRDMKNPDFGPRYMNYSVENEGRGFTEC